MNNKVLNVGDRRRLGRIVRSSAEVCDAISVQFTYQYSFRIRRSWRLKPLYDGIIQIDADAPFIVAAIQYWIEGRKDERKYFQARYSLTVDKLPVIASLDPCPVWPTCLYEPSQVAKLRLTDTKCDRKKLRYRKHGGRGLRIIISLVGWKSFPVTDSPQADLAPNPSGSAAIQTKGTK